MRIALFVALASLALSSTACGTEVSFIASDMNTKPGPARAPKDVALLMTTPQRSYREVGLITARPKSSLSSKNAEDMYRELRAEGAKRGCDAVLVLASEDDSPGGYRYHGGRSGSVGSSTGALAGMAASSGRAYRAACLVFSDEQPYTAGGDARQGT